MDQSNHPFALLDWIERPAFCVSDGHIVAVNGAASQFQLNAGMPVTPLLGNHAQAYEDLSQGCLYLTLSVNGIPCGASVQHMDGFDLFLLDQSDESLRALALAAQHLRLPLSNVMIASDRLFSQLEQTECSAQAEHINRGLYQLLRIISNMSDAGNYQASGQVVMETVNFTAIADEFVEKARTMTESTGITIQYTGLNEPVLGLANPEQLQRAFYNLLSNAIKFTTTGEVIDIKLVKCNHQLRFIICNPSAPKQSGDLFACYRRTAGIEDSRNGLGLGLTLVRAVASAHRGTVLIDHPEGTHTRVTMTVAIQKPDSSNTVRSTTNRVSDYAGGRDKGLLELSEVLKPSAYHKIN